MAGFHIERGTLPFKGFCLAPEASTRSQPGRGMLRASSGTSSRRGERDPSPQQPSALMAGGAAAPPARPQPRPRA